MSSALVKPISRCRSCGSDRLEEVLDLGNLAVSDFVADPSAPVDRAPLVLVYCAHCAMVQLAHTYDRDKLYKTTYWYKSSVNETMVAALKDVADEALANVGPLEPHDVVLDIGANDGTLLSFFPEGVHRWAVEPSPIGEQAIRDGHCDCLFPYYFPLPRDGRSRLGPSAGAVKVILSIAQFYNVDDVNQYVAQIKDILHPEGVWVVQFQDLAHMLRCNGVDNVCHEHVTYPSRQAMQHLLGRHGLGIDSWSEHRVNGGSLRLIVTHAERARHQRAVPETDQGWRAWLRSFAAKAEANKHDVVRYLEHRRRYGQSVYGYAASTKANTLLQFYGIGPDLVTAFAERSPEKWGRYTVGTNIPIVSEQAVRDARPDCLLVGAWQFADAFARREADLLATGTRLVVPLPRLHVIGGEELPAAA